MQKLYCNRRWVFFIRKLTTMKIVSARNSSSRGQMTRPCNAKKPNRSHGMLIVYTLKTMVMRFQLILYIEINLDFNVSMLIPFDYTWSTSHEWYNAIQLVQTRMITRLMKGTTFLLWILILVTKSLRRWKLTIVFILCL